MLVLLNKWITTIQKFVDWRHFNTPPPPKKKFNQSKHRRLIQFMYRIYKNYDMVLDFDGICLSLAEKQTCMNKNANILDNLL